MKDIAEMDKEVLALVKVMHNNENEVYDEKWNQLCFSYPTEPGIIVV